MDGSTKVKLTRSEQCQANAKKRSELKCQATLTALVQLQREKRIITKAAVARQAGVSLVFLRNHPDLLQAIEEAARTREAAASPVPLQQCAEVLNYRAASPSSSFDRRTIDSIFLNTAVGDNAKDQVIAALRRRLEEMKQQLAAKDQELRRK